jgi:hypothetical protein
MWKATLFARALAALSALVAASCAGVDPDYASLKAGRFQGSLVVVWIGEGGGSGDGRFLYVPDPDDPLTFRRSDATAAGAVIRPGIMYTDGGSIPKIAQAFRGFSPWGYAPAYMIHDWLFVARHCLKDGSPDQRYRPLAAVTFPDSAKIIGEAIRTLVETRRVSRDDTAAGLITAAVGTEIARRLWDEDGACARSTVSPEDLALAEAVIPGSAGVKSARAARAAPTGRARFVTRVSF